MKYLARILLAANCLLLASLIPAQHKDTERQFSIQFPDGWRKIPEGAHARAGLDSSTKEAGIEAFLGFSPSGDYTHPYAEIQVLKSTLTGYTTADLRAWFQATAGDFTEIEEGAERPSLAEITSPLLDLERKLYIQAITIDGAGKDTVRAFHIGFLGKDHLLQLYLYAREDQFAALCESFDKTITSFHFEPDYAWEPAFGFRIAGILLLFFALLMTPLVFKKKDRQKS